MNSVEREPWLLVQEGSKISLLAKDHQAYYLIAVNKRLTAEAEEQLSSGSITKPRLEEMGLTFREIPKDQVRGMALTGSEAGETLYFYLTTGKKRKFEFSDDYEPEETDAFFAGLERFTPPGNKKKKKDPDRWRVEAQDPQLFKKLGYLPPVLTLLAIGGGIGYIVYRNWIWYLACVVWPLAAVVLDIVFPAYFTLIIEKGRKKKAHDATWPLIVHALVMVLFTWNNWLDESLFWKLLALLGLLGVLVMGLLAEEFKRKKEYLLLVFLIAGFICALNVVQINRVFDFSEPETYTLAVEDLNYYNGETDTYECVVTLPDGREAEITIWKEFYEDLNVGDEVRINLFSGALGIEYTKAYPLE